MAAGHSYIGLTLNSRSPGDPHETQKNQEPPIMAQSEESRGYKVEHFTSWEPARVKLLVASSIGHRSAIAARDRSGDHLRSFWVEGDGRDVRPVARGT
jgi:hypothetical protein